MEEPQQPNEGEVNNQDFKLSLNFLGSFAGLCIINLVSALDFAILVGALPMLTKDLNGTALHAFWLATAFLLTSTVFQPVWASLSHIYGRRPIILFAIAFFTAGTVVCSAARSMTTLITGRSLQGFGNGGLISLSFIILTDLIPLRQRPKWSSFVQLQWAIGSVASPLISGAIVANTTNWRWLFILNYPFCAAGFVAFAVYLRLQQRLGGFGQKTLSFDWTGGLLFTASITSFLMALTWGGVMFDWNSWHVLVPLLLGATGLLSFGVYIHERENPIIPRSLFKNATSVVAYMGTICLGFCLGCTVYLTPLYYMAVRDRTALMAAVSCLWFIISMLMTSITTGILVTKLGHYRNFVYAGWFFVTLGYGLNFYIDRYTSEVALAFTYMVTGFGMGIVSTVQNIMTQAATQNKDSAAAAMMFSFTRTLGQCLGVAISGVILENRFQASIRDSTYAPQAEEWSRGLESLIEIVQSLASSDPMKAAMEEAYVQGLKWVWIVVTAFAGVLFSSSVLFVKKYSIDRNLETDQGIVSSSRNTQTEGGERPAGGASSCRDSKESS
ncbi:major facilitator superfamily domain-containing protein [Whalleya microplaca]|nr:major facilitator superfamily domain-containing protein [Whalleya microplaca]